MELKDEILLAIPDDCSMQPHKLKGGASKVNINAIHQLCLEGFVTGTKDTCGGFVVFELTDLGKLRKAELIRLRDRSWGRKCLDLLISITQNKKLHTICEWVFGIIASLIITYISYLLGWI